MEGLRPFVVRGFLVVSVAVSPLLRHRRVSWVLSCFCCRPLCLLCVFFVCCISGKFASIRKIWAVGQDTKTNSGICLCFVVVFYVESLQGSKIATKKKLCGQKSQIWSLYPESGHKSQCQASTRK